MKGKKTTMELRHKTTTDDGMGNFTTTWAGLRNITGVLSTIRGDERLANDKITVVQTHNLYIDFPIGITITEEDEFYYGTRKFKIIYINDMGANQGRILKITLKEEV